MFQQVLSKIVVLAGIVSSIGQILVSLERSSVKELKEGILSEKPKYTGGLLDSYVAGYWARIAKDKILQDDDLRVGTVLDHQFAYGFVISGVLKDDKNFGRCMRKNLNSMETKITNIIQERAKTMEEPGGSAAVEKTANLFDSNSPMFRTAIFTCLGLVGGLTLCGLVYEFACYRPNQQKEAKKSEVERIITPETSYENLLAQQCTEIEEAMMHEVQRFYIAWNKKLEEIKRGSGQKCATDVAVAGMNGNDMSAM